MESNKEEAIKAKGIAEKKMEAKDFVGARKIALKAQRLYPDLENIAQIIIACDVHSSAESKVYGSEKDWYGILQIAPTADEASIKKQFRKFALLLHPDKNKFAGAADAFKLIGEAQRVLLDHEKRMLYDIKRKSAVPNGATRQACRQSNVSKPPSSGNNFASNAAQFQGKRFQQPQQTAQMGPSHSNHPTFWTVCPFCSVRYQYYRNVLNKLLGCQSCGKSFTGYEVNAQGVSQGINLKQYAVPSQKEARSHGPSNVGLQNNFEKSTTKEEIERNIDSRNTKGFYSKAGPSSEVGEGYKPNDKGGDVNTSFEKKNRSGKSQPCGNINGMKKHTTESSESFQSESSTSSEEDIIIEEGGFYSEQFPRRSSRSKRNVSYTENIDDDDDDDVPSKRAKRSGSPLPSEEKVQGTPPKQDPQSVDCQAGLEAHVEVDEDGAKSKEHSLSEERLQNEGSKTAKASEKENLTADAAEEPEDAAEEPEFYECPDPDFNDFDKNRTEKCFAVGQMWAIYDTLGAMPRFYARIRKVVLYPKFKLRITWLEPDPDDEDEIRWVEEDLPISCGKYRHGSSENTEDLPMFSHLVLWEKGEEKDTYKIYPRKGEIWALFKNWDINWSSDPENHKKYEYDFVEVLSDYADGLSVSVAYLAKLKGFSCLFSRTRREGVESVEIPSKELLIFSHRVPSFRMTGEEREDVPKGSFELDPACLPSDLEEIDVPIIEEMEAGNLHPNGSGHRMSSDAVGCRADVFVNQDEDKSHSHSHVDVSVNQESQNISSDSKGNNSHNLPEGRGSCTPSGSPNEEYEVPDPEFYNFDANKSPEKFESGQIWALYCDDDGLPKYYTKITKIDHLPEFKLHTVSLGGGVAPKDMIQWIDKKMPVSCGRFRIQRVKVAHYTSTLCFSHQVKAETSDKNEEYYIFPRKGEVWGLYKHWHAGMIRSDLDTCDYEMVEILEENSFGITVLVLELVDGFKSVFKAQMKGESTATITIPRTELLRFSHQIPAFRLTDERDGSLRGYLELDPSALPIYFFS